MRARNFVFGLSAVLGLAAFSMQACGGDSVEDATADAGLDAPAEARPFDAGVDTGVDAAPPCDLSGSLTEDIPDASLADGATSSGICVGCLSAKCPAPIAACDKDCNCREVVSTILACYATGSSLQQCLFSSNANPSKETQQIGLQLVGCIQSDCNDECAVDELLPDAGADGGDAGDAGDP